jgi:hypothetical protein
MNALTIISGNLPEKALEVLKEAASKAYGADTVGIESLDISPKLTMKCINAANDSTILLVVLSKIDSEYVKASYPGISDIDKVYEFDGSVNNLILYLRKLWGIELNLVSEEKTSDSSEETNYGGLLYANKKLQDKVDTLQGIISKQTSELKVAKESLEIADKRYLHSLNTSTPSTPDIVATNQQLPDMKITNQKGIIPYLTIVASANADSERSMLHYVTRNMLDNKETVVLDLTSPTSSDYYFRLQDVVSCTDWLTGGKDWESVSMESGRGNHNKILSLGFTRVSRDWLLSLDWYSLLSSINKEIIVILGSISDDSVLRLFTLFASLTSIPPMVIVRGTVLNVRNASITMVPITYTVNLGIYESETNLPLDKVTFPPVVLVKKLD